VCDGIIAVLADSPGGETTAVVALDDAAHMFAAGHRLRLQVSGGAFPRFARNTGTSEPLTSGERLAATDISVWHDGTRQSALFLPEVRRPENRSRSQQR
jgi:uncharacterized protein